MMRLSDFRIFTLLAPCCWVLFLACAATTGEVDHKEASPAASAENAAVGPSYSAIDRGLVFLLRDGIAWMDGRIPIQSGAPCVSCHVVSFALWSHNEAKRSGIEIPQEEVDDLARRALEFVAPPGVGRAASWSQLALGRDFVDPAGSEIRKQTLDDWPTYQNQLADLQQSDGHFRARGQFPSQKRPIEETDAITTMGAILAFSSFNSPTEEALESQAKALRWLEAAPPGESTEWLLMRALTEQELGSKDKAAEHLEGLLSQQNEDGGWGWSPGGESNAYSTGQMLHGLALLGLHRDHDAVTAAVGRLLATQQEDGTWLVPSHLTSREPTEGKDYVYKYWGTAWAVMGLSRFLPAEREGLAPT